MQAPNKTFVTEFILLGFSLSPRATPLLFSAFLTIYLLIILGNGLIFILICLDSHLHTPMYFFIGILSMLDLGYTTTTVPQMLAHLVSQRKTISYSSCVTQMYIFLVFGVTESWLFAIMSIDRYVAICHPLRYRVIMSPCLCGVMVIFCGLCGVTSALVYTIFAMRLPYCGPNKINHFFCEVPAVLKLACADTSVNDQVDFILGFSVILIPLSVILVIYVNIFASILKIRSAQGRLKAFSTCASHITVVTMFCVPAMVMYMKPGSKASPEEDKKLALFYNVISAFLNPVIYSLRNKDVKRAFLKVTGRGRPQNESLERHGQYSSYVIIVQELIHVTAGPMHPPFYLSFHFYTGSLREHPLFAGGTGHYEMSPRHASSHLPLFFYRG